MLLIAFAALMHATWNLSAKRAQGGQLFSTLCSLCALVIYGLPVGLLVNAHGLPTSQTAWLVMLGSGVIHLVYFNVLQAGYRAADLSVVYPVARGTGPLLGIGFAVAALHERPSLQALCGAAIVVVGVFLLAGGTALLGQRDARARTGLLWGACTGLFIASYTVLDGYAVRSRAIAPLVLDYVSQVTRVIVSAPSALRDLPALRAEWRRTYRHALVVATLGPLGYILVLTAMRYSPVSYVAPARELSMLVGAFFGAQLLKEGELLRRLFSAGLIGVGVLLIALG
jgi:drug/metabolite transporter (DMT)-like permease